MFLPEYSIRRPVAATVMVLALVFFGIISLGRLGILLYPDVDFPMVTVSTIWENARPEEVDNDITEELEDAIGGVSGVKHITSDSYEGLSRITVEFELYKDVDVAAQEIRDKVSTRLHELPEEAESPIVDKLDINAQPVIWLALSGQRPVEVLTDYADNNIKPLLQKLKGVGEVRIGGGRERKIRIWLRRDRLAAYKLGVNDVIEAVRSQHIEVPGGKVESETREFLVRTMGEFPSAKAFNDLIIAYRGDTTIRLSDVGYAESGREDFATAARYTSRYGTNKAVGVGVAPRSGANEVEIARLVRDELVKIRKMLPSGMHMEIASDNTVFVEESINEVKFHLLVGGIMAALVIFLFLQNVRTTIFSAIAIPTSIISTFTAIYAFGFTLNNMSMLALITAVGLVIDDSIVMEENIYRHRFELGKDPITAARDGSSEIGFAVIASTLTLAGVFLPVAFMGGIVGRFFREFALTMAFAVCASSFVALTVEPMLASRFLKAGGEKWRLFGLFETMMRRATRFYRRSLAWLLDRRYMVVILGILAVAAGGIMFKILGKEFIRAEDKSKFMIRLETPLSYSTEKTDEVLKRVEEQLKQIPEIKHFFSIAGYGGGGVQQSNKGLMFVTLLPKNQREMSQFEIQAKVRRIMAKIPDLRGLASEISILGSGSRSEDLQFVIQGPSIEGLDRHSREIMAELSELPGFVDLNRTLELRKPEVRVHIDRDKAADLGVDVRTIADAVGVLIGGRDLVEYKEAGKSYDVRARLVEEERTSPTDLSRIWIRNQRGDIVDLAGLVTLETGVGPSVINRLDRQRAVTIYANLEGKTLGKAMAELDRIAAGVLPEGYTTKYMGRSEAFQETGYYIGFAFVLAIILTYMVLAAQFENFIYPFSIMMGLPVSFVGAFGLLYITGNTFNLYSMIALVLLVGLPSKNGILLVDLTNQLRAKGVPLKEALVEASSTRMRPILMTAASTMAGVVPVALGIGVGSESRQPMALAIAGGLLSSTLLTLVIVPVVYSYLDGFTRWRLFARLKRLIWAEDLAQAEDAGKAAE